ncbi:MAG: hypothetical protein Q8N39_11280 [Pelolinea sp.]|nr:hypothetical protein [Pelolinea sp.]
MQLTALALPTDPPSFGWVPQPLSMKEVKELGAILARAFHVPVIRDTPGIIAG